MIRLSLEVKLKNALKKINKTTFEIANPDENYNGTDNIIKSKLPDRRLLYTYMSENYFIFSYNKNKGTSTAERCVVIRYIKEKEISWVISFKPPLVDKLEELIEFIKYKRNLLCPEVDI